MVTKLTRKLPGHLSSFEDTNVQKLRGRLPLVSVELLNEMEEELKTSEEAFKHLTAYLAQSGGEDIGSATRSALRKLMTDEVQAEYSWEGMKKKKRLDKLTYVLRAIFESVRIHFPRATDSEIKTAVTNDLRNAKQRLDGKRKKDMVDLGSEED